MATANLRALGRYDSKHDDGPWAKQNLHGLAVKRAQHFKCGRLLIDTKEELAHGQFKRMIADALPFDSTTAARLMRIAHDQRLIECACATFAAELVEL